jgi:hypothetical protein
VVIAQPLLEMATLGLFFSSPQIHFESGTCYMQWMTSTLLPSRPLEFDAGRLWLLSITSPAAGAGSASYRQCPSPSMESSAVIFKVPILSLCAIMTSRLDRRPVSRQLVVFQFR